MQSEAVMQKLKAQPTRDALMKASTAFTCEYEVPQLPLLSKQTCQLADRAMLGKVALHQNAACVGSMQLHYNSRSNSCISPLHGIEFGVGGLSDAKVNQGAHEKDVSRHAAEDWAVTKTPALCLEHSSL